MVYKLFLDDVRNPVHCVTYMQSRIGWKNPIYLQNDWMICRNYESFKNTLEAEGLPEFVSFDHDLADEHYAPETDDYQYIEKTGLDCAKYLVDYCIKNKLKLPQYACHSMNPAGTKNIMEYLETAKKWL
jgi:hypothetical protein